ncbi:PAS domain-containing protein [uncultured Cohaesibacter sp.]|uniref:PAS domain-containing protein n=1 Tax=uncultured Cohaesibacter sp. TaxID=1002546 RepID=UPI0029C7835A|nr:PAS domain-containing protein [uncultured Cohaesibacter sp.]
MFSLGFLLLAGGAFALTLSGGWLWLGALMWLLAGTCIAAGLIRNVAYPAVPADAAFDHSSGLRSQLKRLDQACEQLQDQNWELREAEQKYKALLNRQGDIILHLGPEGSIQFANDAFSRFFEPDVAGSPFKPDEDAINLQQDADLATADPLWEKLIDTRRGTALVPLDRDDDALCTEG